MQRLINWLAAHPLPILLLTVLLSAAAALTKKARAVAMSPLAKATSPSAHSRRASSIGIASVAPRLPTACWSTGCSRSAVASLLIAALSIG